MNTKAARWIGISSTIVLALWLAGCQTAPPAPSSAGTQPESFDQAVDRVVASDLAQIEERGGTIEKLAAAAGRPTPHKVVVDPMIDGSSGLQTALSTDFQRRVLERISKHPQYTVLPISSESLAAADLLLTGTIAIETSGKSGSTAAGAPARLHVAFTDIKTGVVAAHASAYVVNTGFDLTPSQLDQDSPVVALDRPVSGYITTTATDAGHPGDAVYLRNLAPAFAIALGTQEYNQAKYPEALTHFQQASAQSSDQLRAYIGTYLSDVKLGHLDEAEKAFGKIVDFGITKRDLGVKFLFTPNTTEFWPDAKVSGMYGVWIRQIAREVDKANLCVEVVGHASKTGTDAYNDRLSEQRAARIKAGLVGEVDRLNQRLTVRGAGSREAIVGIGTDDIRDAVDRRVAFQFKECR